MRGTHLIIAALAAVIAILSWALVYFARDEMGVQTAEREEEIETGSTAGVESGRAVVRVSVESQKVSGIAVQPLEAGRSEAEVEAYGTVVNLQSLAEQRGRYLAAAAEARALRAVVAAAESDYRRMQALFRDDRNVSEQALGAAEARYRSEFARQSAAEQTAAAVRDALRSAWGETIAGWAANPDSGAIRSLLQQRTCLVQLVLPHDLTRIAPRAMVRVAPAVARENFRPARFVSESPQADAMHSGATHFYVAEGGDFRAGMRVAARIGLGASPLRGVIVPSPAVVWHAGKAWAYVRTDERTFARYEVSTAGETDGGWFNASGFEAGADVVVSGAQLLLSEELKYQIRNENED